MHERTPGVFLPNPLPDLSTHVALYLYLTEHSLNEIVEDNASCHGNECIRQLHRSHGVKRVGYEASDEEKKQIKDPISQQVHVCKCSASHTRLHIHTHVSLCVFTDRLRMTNVLEKDRTVQIIKQTRELDRLPAWTLSFGRGCVMISQTCQEVDRIHRRILKLRWDNVCLDSFVELVRCYRQRVLAIVCVGGDRHSAYV